METKVYKQLSSLLIALENCDKSGSNLWYEKHSQTLEGIMNTAPSGSGIDCGTKLSVDSKPGRLVFNVEYHHMNENGMYDGWTTHKVIVTPSLAFDFDLRITGTNRNDIKDYLHQVYGSWLNQTIGLIADSDKNIEVSIVG